MLDCVIDYLTTGSMQNYKTALIKAALFYQLELNGSLRGV